MIYRFIFLLFVFTNLHSQTIITLIMPPGSNSAGMADAGVSSSKNLSSLFYNPAILSSLYEYNESRFHFQRFKNELLPNVFNEKLSQEYTAFGVSSETIYGVASFGLGYYKNEIDFGMQRFPDTTLYRPFETVEALTLSLRFFNYLSIGYNYKWVYSLLLPPTTWDPEGAEARSKTHDIGFLLSHKYWLPFKGLYIEPAIGITFANSDDSIHYREPENKEAIMHERWSSYTIRGGYLELAEVVFTQDRNIDLVNDSTPHFDKYGVQISATPFLTFSTGYLDDDPGKRHEYHFAWSIKFNFNKTLVFLNRIRRFDFITPYSKLKKESSIINWKYMPNLVMEYSESIINVEEGGPRDGQSSYQIYLSL